MVIGNFAPLRTTSYGFIYIMRCLHASKPITRHFRTWKVQAMRKQMMPRL